jgi:hypothetical protein
MRAVQTEHHDTDECERNESGLAASPPTDSRTAVRLR